MLDKVVCLFPECHRSVARARFKRHFVATHLGPGESYTADTPLKYAHDASDCRIHAGWFSTRRPPRRKKAPASRRRDAKADSESRFQLTDEDWDKLVREVLSGGRRAGAPAAARATPTVVTDAEGSDSELVIDSSDAGGACRAKRLPLVGRSAAGPIGKVAPASPASTTKRRLVFDGDSGVSSSDSDPDSERASEEPTDVPKPPRAGLTTRRVAKPARDGAEAAKKRRVEVGESATSKAEVVTTFMSTHGEPEVARELHGSRRKANSTVRTAWNNALRVGVPCELFVDELGYCKLTIANADGSQDSIAAHRVPQYKKLFAPASD